MKNRTIILCLSVLLFGMAFGCKPLSENAADYMLAYQHTTEHDILIIDTEIDVGKATVDSCAAKLNIDGVSKTISGDNIVCAIVSNSKRGWFAIKLDKGLLPAQSGSVIVKIKYHYESDGEQVGDTCNAETALLDITKAKNHPIKMTSVEWDENDGGNYNYNFAISLPTAASNTNLIISINEKSMINIPIPIPNACTNDECSFSASTYGVGVALKLVRAVTKTEPVGTPITPLLLVKGCTQTAEVAGKDGAGFCLPYKAVDTPPNCETDPTAEGCPNSPACEADPTAEGCPNSPACVDDPTAEGCEDPNNPDQDPNDLDGDFVNNEDDKCPDQKEIYTWSSLRPTDGVLDGCPDSDSSTEPNLGEGEGTTDLPGMGSDGSGCSLNPMAGSNPAALLLMLTALAGMVIRRKR
jgi:hypothetical protein